MWIIFKRFWREIIIAILVIIVAISVNTCESKSNAVEDAELFAHQRDSAYFVAKAYKLKNGDLVHRVKTQELTISQVKKYGEKLFDENKSLKQQVGNYKNLVGYWQVKATASQTVFIQGKDTTIYIDNTPQQAITFPWLGKFMSLNGIYIPKTKLLTVDYTYNPSFDLTAYYRGRTFFKRGELVSDVKFHDPSIKVQEMRGFVIKMDPPRWYETKVAIFIEGAIIGSAGTIYVQSKLK